ncbi:MAG TPA: Ig-like domain-containing protein [Blastocatellia bacterium]|nr:Ig-like domain-containing protein [Blastocatellia bacterium]
MFPDHLHLSAAPFLKLLSVRNSRLIAALLTLTIAATLAIAGRAPFISSAAAAMFADNDFAPVTVSAASYETTAIAPDSIVAAFGTKLATGTFVADDADQATAGLQLPTTLGGTTVRINGQAAGLFFVSPNQVNYVIPSGTNSGSATVQITSGDGTVSTGTVQIAQVAPGIFSGNADGEGVPAAYLVRVKADNSVSSESVSQLVNGRLVTRAIDLGPEGERVFLVLFASGLSHASDPNSDNNFSETVRVVMGGTEVTPSFAGRQGYFVGLDQINVEIPRSLTGRGKVSLSVAATGYSASKLSEIEIASPAGTTPPQVAGFSSSSVLAGQTMTINGSGFSTEATDNTVRISGSEATVTSASPSQLTVQVPYGAQSGMVSVRTPQGEGISASALGLRTSISGFVEDTSRQPMSGVTVKVVGTSTQVTTNSEGLFILPDVTAGAALVEIDAQNVTSPPFPKVTLKMPVTAARDNQFSRPVSLQQATGASLPVGSGGSNQPQSVSVALPPDRHSGRYKPGGTITSGSVTFDLPAGTATFPDGASSGTIYLTLLDNSRTPVDLPGGHFSTAIAQLSPFGVTLSPGGKLSFPNPENWAAGSEGTLFRFEQNPNSASVGRFVEAGTARVSSDGQRIETADGAITTTGIYFVSRLRQTTTVTGRVFDSDGKTPVRNALVRARGQETFTDGNGGFIIRSVPVKAGETISVEASFLRPNGRVDRKQSAEVPVVVGGITNITPDIVLPAPALNRPPVIQAPATFTISEGQNTDLRIAAFDPDDGQTITLSLTGPGFASLIDGTEKLVRLTPGFSDAGTYTLTLTAKDNLNAITTRTIALTVSNTNRPPSSGGQSLTTSEDTALNITLSGSDPDGDTITFIPLLAPAHGTISGTAPNLIYTPASNYNGADSFTFKVSDGGLNSPTYTVNITISAVNDAPVANGQSATTAEDTPKAITLTGSDVEGSALTFTVVNGPANGTLNGTAPNLTYTPNLNFNGTDSFTFKVNDGQLDSAPATITLNVQAVNDAPTINVPGQQTVVTEDLLSFTISGSDVDAGQTLTFAAMNLPPGANFDPATKTFTWTPAWNQVGTFDVDFKVQDNGAPPQSNVGQVRIIVNPVLSWTQNADGPNGGEIFALVGDPSMLLAGTYEGIFKSTDGGAFWLKSNGNLPPGGAVNSFAGSASNGFISRHGTGPNDGVWRTTDGGATWTQASNGLPAVFIHALLMNGTTLLAATENGIFRSTDNGANWSQSSNGLQSPRVLSLGAVGTSLFAGTDQGISLSTDDGSTWTSLNAGLPPAPLNIPAMMTTGSRLFAAVNESVYELSSDGQSWLNDGFGLPGSSQVSALAMNGSELFAGTMGYGVYKTRIDTAPYFVPASNGLRNRVISALMPVGPELYAGTFGGGVWKSTDGGQNWTSATAGIRLSRPRCFAQIGSTLFAGTQGNGLFMTTDNGITWNPASGNLPGWEITALAADGTDLYAGTRGDGLWFSRDNGTTWNQIEIEYTYGGPITSIVVSGSEIYASTPNGIIKSPVGNYSFSLAINGLASTDVRALAAPGTDLYAATADGIFRSIDRGLTWSQVGSAATGLTNLDVRSLTTDTTNIYAGTAGGIFKMPLTVGNWTAINTGVTNLNINQVTAYSGKLFAATGGGVFFSTDGGAKWKNGSYNLFNQNVKALFVSGAKVFAGTDGSAAWSSSY